MLKPILAAVVALGATTALAAGHAQNRIDGQRPDAPELAAPGEFKVGVRTLEMINPGQIDMMAVSAAEPLPDPDVIKAEVAAVAPELDFAIMTVPSSVT